MKCVFIRIYEINSILINEKIQRCCDEITFDFLFVYKSLINIKQTYSIFIINLKCNIHFYVL